MYFLGVHGMFSDEDAEFLQDQPVEESSGNSQLEDINNIVAWVSLNCIQYIQCYVIHFFIDKGYW